MIADESAPAAEEGDNYFVSMTDMMVGVLFVFIILLMVFALDFRTKSDVQDSAIDNAREVARKLEILQKDVQDQIATMDKSQETRRKLLATLKKELEADGMDVKVDEANGVLRLTEEAIRFDVGQSVLREQARLNVDKIARVLSRIIPGYVTCRDNQRDNCRKQQDAGIETVFIEGHTDSTGARGADDQSNWQLSAERSVNTYREIVTAAPGLRALRNTRNEEIVSVSGYASTRPIDASENREAWARNRRIDLRFVMEVDARQRLEQIMHLTDAMKAEIDRLVTASGRRK